MRNDATQSCGANPVVRCSLPESEMRAVVVIVADVVSEHSFQMGFIQRNDVIQVSPAAFNPTLCHGVLPGTLEGGPHRAHLQGSNGHGYFQSIFRIPVKDQEPGSRPKRKRLPQLLDDPHARQMFRDVQVQDPPPIVVDDEEAVEHAERDRWNCEEIHRSNRFPMVAQKRKPALGWFGVSRRSAHPAGDRSLRDIKAKHEEFAMYAWRSPGWILANHPEDQISNLFGDSLPAEHAVRPGDGAPVQGEPSSVPSHDCFRVHDNGAVIVGLDFSARYRCPCRTRSATARKDLVGALE